MWNLYTDAWSWTKEYLCRVCRANFVRTPMLVADLAWNDSKCTIAGTWHRMMRRYQCLVLCWRRIQDTTFWWAWYKSKFHQSYTDHEICMRRRIWNSIIVEYHWSTCTRTTLHFVCVTDREYVTLIQYHTSKILAYAKLARHVDEKWSLFKICTKSMQDTIAWSTYEKCGLEVLNQVRESSNNDTDT